MSSKNIAVVGIFVVDLSFIAKKLPSPGETIIGDNYIIGPGGKESNQAVAISRSGGKPSLILLLKLEKLLHNYQSHIP